MYKYCIKSPVSKLCTILQSINKLYYNNTLYPIFILKRISNNKDLYIVKN